MQRRTDARGAYQTFAYNARHLITAITHFKPEGSAPEGVNGILGPPKGTNATFTYDAAGNRLSMNETINRIATGSTTYVYNTISQLTAETRTIPGVGSFPLSYTYSLGGQLKTLSDPFNSVVTYAYNKVGELTTVTGSGYPKVSQLAANFQYRAWGALKHMNYGNGKTLDLRYNSKLLLTSHNDSLNQVITLQYYNDGRVKSVRYPTDSQPNCADRICSETFIMFLTSC